MIKRILWVFSFVRDSKKRANYRLTAMTRATPQDILDVNGFLCHSLRSIV